MRYFLVVCFILSIGNPSCGSSRVHSRDMREGIGSQAQLRRVPVNAYRVLFEEFLKRKYEDTNAERVDAERGLATAGVSGRTRTALNKLFNQERDFFKNKSYFLRLFDLEDNFEASQQISDDKMISRKTLRETFRSTFHKPGTFEQEKRDKYEIFRLLLALDEAQDLEKRGDITRAVASIFENPHPSLNSIRDMYVEELKGQNLKVFIRFLDPGFFFSHPTKLARILLADGEHKGRGKIWGKLLEVESKIASGPSLYFSGMACCFGIIGSCIALTYNTSKTSLAIDEEISSTVNVTNAVTNVTTPFSLLSTIEWVYRKASSSTPQTVSAVGLLAAAGYWGSKFIHDASFRWNAASFRNSLNWIALYITAQPREAREGLIEMAAGALEKALQRQIHFIGSYRKRNSFVMEVMDIIDEYASYKEE